MARELIEKALVVRELIEKVLTEVAQAVRAEVMEDLRMVDLQMAVVLAQEAVLVQVMDQALVQAQEVDLVQVMAQVLVQAQEMVL